MGFKVEQYVFIENNLLSKSQGTDTELTLMALMARKGPEVGIGMLDFVEDLSKDVILH